MGAGSGYLLPLGHPDLEGLLEDALRLAVLFEPRLRVLHLLHPRRYRRLLGLELGLRVRATARAKAGVRVRVGAGVRVGVRVRGSVRVRVRVRVTCSLARF